MPLSNRVQLITYPDSIGNNISDLHQFLNQNLREVIGGIHLLPFYPSSSDRGYAPLTHMEIDPKFGTWEDIQKLSQDYELTADMIVNHISRESVYFQDFLKYGNKSTFKPLFLTKERFTNSSELSKNDMDLIYRPRPEYPFVQCLLGDGNQVTLWCTFASDQIDLDYGSIETKNLLYQTLESLAMHGIILIRLDAIGYSIKKLGTNCFMLPQTYDLIKEIQTHAHNLNIQILPEVHSHFQTQLDLAQSVDFVYDFALPALVLHTLYQQNSLALQHWLTICPHNQITTLDTHDGIPIKDIQGLLSLEQIDELIEKLFQMGANSMNRTSGPEAKNLDIYQINCSYYSATGENDDVYFAARAIQIFAPGIPQIYYMGLLAGQNDVEFYTQTNSGRDINRHYYFLDEAQDALQKPVVKRILELCKLRNTHPAFNGSFEIITTDSSNLEIHWTNQIDGRLSYCNLHIDLKTYTTKIVQSS